jgi:hypothetical protein
MGSRKEHHFLPKFYLKHFSVDQDDTHICIYNIDTNFSFDCASISGQAKAKYLYGTDDVMEARLGEIENQSARIIRAIIDDNRLPSSPADVQKLGEFILYQHARTIRNAEVMNSMTDSLNQSMFGDAAPDQETSVRELLELMDRRLPYLAYLDYKLVINDNPTPFITCDHPVVLYNRMMEIKRHTTPGAWANMGLQVFFPISPDHLIYIHDTFTYSASGRAGSAVIDNPTERDIAQLNTLQFLNCGQMLYFDNHFSKSDAETLTRNNAEGRKKLWTPNPLQFGPYHFVDIGRPRTNLDLSFSRLSPRATRFKPGNRMVYLRHTDFYHYRDSAVPAEFEQ